MEIKQPPVRPGVPQRIPPTAPGRVLPLSKQPAPVTKAPPRRPGVTQRFPRRDPTFG